VSDPDLLQRPWDGPGQFNTMTVDEYKVALADLNRQFVAI